MVRQAEVRQSDGSTFRIAKQAKNFNAVEGKKIHKIQSRT